MQDPRPSRPIRDAADIGQVLRRTRKQQRLTQAEAAGLSDVGIRFLSELENGKPTVRLETVLKVLAAYGLELRLSGPDLEPPTEPPAADSRFRQDDRRPTGTRRPPENRPTLDDHRPPENRPTLDDRRPRKDPR